MDIDSLVCDASTVISEDYQFLNWEDHNYLHLMVWPSMVKIINPDLHSVMEDTADESNNTSDDYLIEIGCKVVSMDKVDIYL